MCGLRFVCIVVHNVNYDTLARGLLDLGWSPLLCVRNSHELAQKLTQNWFLCPTQIPDGVLHMSNSTHETLYLSPGTTNVFALMNRD